MELALVYMVAGMSSRFGGRAKGFAKVGKNNEPLIEVSINQAVKAGFTKIIFIVSKKTQELFYEMFKSSYKNIPIYYAVQEYDESSRDRPWGTADAICCASSLIDCPFVVCNGDDIYGEETFKIMANHLKSSKDEATIGYHLKNAMPAKGTANRGIFKVEKGFVQSITETYNISLLDLSKHNLTPEDLCSMNMYALHPSVLKNLSSRVKKFKQERSGDRKAECLLPQELSFMISNGEIRLKLYSTPDKWLGITNPEDEEIVRQAIQNL
jgi:NDP-sugar pyrophosphorylase family protein